MVYDELLSLHRQSLNPAVATFGSIINTVLLTVLCDIISSEYIQELLVI